MKPPVEPNKEDCCNSGCNPCIFDVFEKELSQYKKYIEFGEISVQQENAISQLEYTKFLVVKNIELCHLHNLIEFKIVMLENRVVWWKPGDHFLFKYNLFDISCTRAYTPLNLGDGDCDFAVIVKMYDSGIVSKHLCSLEVGQETLWRGPYGSYKVVPNKYKRIFMIAQGTGIAPFISIIESILGDEDDMTRVYLLYCCQNIDTILLRDKLYGLNSYWNFNYEIFVGGNTNGSVKYLEPVTEHKLSMENINVFKPFTEKDQFLLCGSCQFMDHYNDTLTTEDVLQTNIIKF